MYRKPKIDHKFTFQSSVGNNLHIIEEHLHSKVMIYLYKYDAVIY